MPFVRGDIIMPLVWNDNLNQGSYIKINDFVNNLKTIAKKIFRARKLQYI